MYYQLRSLVKQGDVLVCLCVCNKWAYANNHVDVVDRILMICNCLIFWIKGVSIILCAFYNLNNVRILVGGWSKNLLDGGWVGQNKSERCSNCKKLTK